MTQKLNAKRFSDRPDFVKNNSTRAKLQPERLNVTETLHLLVTIHDTNTSLSTWYIIVTMLMTSLMDQQLSTAETFKKRKERKYHLKVKQSEQILPAKVRTILYRTRLSVESSPDNRHQISPDCD